MTKKKEKKEDLDTTTIESESSHETMASAISKTALERQRLNSEIRVCIDTDKEIDAKMGLRAIILNLFNGNNEPRLDILEDRMNTTENTLDIVESLADANANATAANATAIKEQRNEIIYAQIEATRNRVIIRNLPVHPSTKTGEKERQKNTIEVMTDLFVSLKLEMRHFPDCYRFAPPKQVLTRNAKAKFPIISATFHSSASFTAFMASLSNLKNNEKHKFVRIEKDLPSILRPSNDRANAKAYELRSKKQMITKVVIVKTELKLFAKKKRDDPWKEVEF